MGKETFYKFVGAINNHDVNSLGELMSDDHIFTDAHGVEVMGRERMKKGWIGYFKWFPDYKIEIREIYEDENTISALGFACGTFEGVNPEENFWRIPAAWKAEIYDGKIAHWQIFADTKIPYDIIEI